MATTKTVKTRNQPALTFLNTINNMNPLVVLFHQVETLYFTLAQMIETQTPGTMTVTGGPFTVNSGITVPTSRVGPTRKLTPAARKKIGAYQRKRWATIKGGKTKAAVAA